MNATPARWVVLFLSLSVVASAQEPRGEQVVVTVDGQAFERSDLERRLFERLGRQFTEYCVDLFLYEQEAARRGLSLTAGELEAFVDLRMIELETAAGGPGAYQELLALTGTSQIEERRRIAEDARGLLLARKLARADRLQDGNLRAAFELRYGALLQARQIFVRFEVPAGEDSVYVAMQCRKRLERITDKLEAGADFARLAQELSDDEQTRGSGGALGTLLIAELEPRFREALQSVPEGGWSEPVETEDGFHLLFVERRQQARESFDAVLDELKTELLQADVSPQEIENLSARLRTEADIRWN